MGYYQNCLQNAVKFLSSERPALHIGKITSEAIIRSLKPSAESDTVLFNEILVNNKTCYPAVHEGLPPVQLSPPQAFKEERPIKNHATPKQRSNQQDDTPTKSDLDFYSSLFGSFAKILPILHPTLPRIVDEARAFLALDCEESLKYGKNHSLLIKQFDKDIPGMGILRLMTNDSFGYAMDYILKLYPALIRKYGSDTPYDLKFLKGITCNVSIDDAGGYFVSQKKKAEICRTGHHNPSIASLEIEWTLSPMKNGWKGILKILSYEIHSDRYWLDLTSILANPVDLSKEPFPKSCQYISKLSGSTRD